MKDRLLIFDLMRLIAIFLILSVHSPGYSFNFYDLRHFGINLNLTMIKEFNAIFGLGLFIFLSGYLINIKKISFPDWRASGIFLYKKILRIFPLYYVALFAFCYMLHVTNPARIIIHSLGLQSLLQSKQWMSLPTLWFIGTILIYYCIFIILKSDLFSKIHKFLIIGLFPFFMFFAHKYLYVTDNRISLFYLIFLFGIYCAESKVLNTIALKKLAAISTFAFTLIFLVGLFVVKKHGFSGLNYISYFLLSNALIFCFVLFMYSICSIVTKRLKSAKTLSTRQFRLELATVQAIAYSSYGMYLFHRPIWFFMSLVAQEKMRIHNEYALLAIQMLIGLPIIIAFSYFAQNFYDKYCLPYFQKS
jgi:hypothetical protein